MRHLKSGRKLKRTASHRKALLCNLATSLFEHKRIRTTEAKAKELRMFAEPIITRAKNAYNQERNAADGAINVHARRMVYRYIRNKGVLQELFDTIAPTVAERNGGYLRITKLGQRRGDGGYEAIIEFVDWSAKQDGVVSLNRKKKAAPKKAAKVEEKVAVAPVVEEAAPVVEETVAEVTEVVEDTIVEETVAEVATAEVVEETSSEEAPATDETPEAPAAEENNDEATA